MVFQHTGEVQISHMSASTYHARHHLMLTVIYSFICLLPRPHLFLPCSAYVDHLTLSFTLKVTALASYPCPRKFEL